MTEKEEELNFDDTKEALVYIAQKLGEIKEIANRDFIIKQFLGQILPRAGSKSKKAK